MTTWGGALGQGLALKFSAKVHQMSSLGEPSSPTEDISNCLQALRLEEASTDNQIDEENTVSFDSNRQTSSNQGSDYSQHQSVDSTESAKDHHIALNSSNDNTANDESLPNPLNFSTTEDVSPITNTPSYMSCRQQACYYPSDITVDELAGYLDELLYLPRPMSDMAELMYT